MARSDMDLPKLSYNDGQNTQLGLIPSLRSGVDIGEAAASDLPPDSFEPATAAEQNAAISLLRDRAAGEAAFPSYRDGLPMGRVVWTLSDEDVRIMRQVAAVQKIELQPVRQHIQVPAQTYVDFAQGPNRWWEILAYPVLPEPVAAVEPVAERSLPEAILDDWLRAPPF